MIIRLALISVVSIFSPAIGLMIAIPFFCKFVACPVRKNDCIGVENSQLFDKKINDSSFSLAILKPLAFFAGFQILLVILKFVGSLQAVEIFISVGLTGLLFALSLQKFRNYEISILSGLSPGFIYIILKNLFFFEQIQNNITQVNEIFLKQIKGLLSPVMFENMEASFHSIFEIMLKGNAVIWLFSIIIGIFIGALIYSKKSESVKEQSLTTPKLIWNFSFVSFPYQLQFLVVIGLVLFIFSYQVIALNILIFCALLYLIQGYSVLYFYLRNTLHRSKFLGIVLLIIPFFSYFILIMLSIIGLLDGWFHLRKFANDKGEKK